MRKKKSPQELAALTRSFNRALREILKEEETAKKRRKKKSLAKKKAPLIQKTERYVDTHEWDGTEYVQKKSSAKSAKVVTGKRSKRESQAVRSRRERSQKSSATRKKGLPGISSKAKRSSTRSLRKQVIGFDLSGILNETSIKAPDIRDDFRKLSASFIGKNVQVTFTVSVEDGEGKVHSSRVRRVVRNFRGNIDIASLSNSAVRWGYELSMKYETDFKEVYITNVSLSVVA